MPISFWRQDFPGNCKTVHDNQEKILTKTQVKTQTYDKLRKNIQNTQQKLSLQSPVHLQLLLIWMCFDCAKCRHPLSIHFPSNCHGDLGLNAQWTTLCTISLKTLAAW